MTPRASASGLTNALRSIGLLEVPDAEVNERLIHPQDDEVSSEIRYLESALIDQTRRNNETKRALRKLLQTYVVSVFSLLQRHGLTDRLSSTVRSLGCRTSRRCRKQRRRST